jgi:DNA-binding NarL/FixJ family response regulator
MNATLTRREREVLQLASMGIRAPRIATLMGVSHSMTKKFLWKAARRLGAENTQHACCIALRKRLIQ